MDNRKLIDAAIEARKLSYSPYSKFAVGAAILTKDGKIISGANIENASYGLCMCAERNAIYQAYLQGYHKDDLVALAVAADIDKPCSPCGACRQVISELMNGSCPVIMTNLNSDVLEMSVKELLPLSFSGEDLK